MPGSIVSNVAPSAASTHSPPNAPRVVEARDRLEAGLRDAALEAEDPGLLAAWCNSPAGQDDAPAARTLVTRLPARDRRLAGARAHLARLERSFA